VRFEVLIAVTANITAFWDVWPYRSEFYILKLEGVIPPTLQLA
jgi:hypothetical protein